MHLKSWITMLMFTQVKGLIPTIFCFYFYISSFSKEKNVFFPLFSSYMKISKKKKTTTNDVEKKKHSQYLIFIINCRLACTHTWTMIWYIQSCYLLFANKHQAYLLRCQYNDIFVSHILNNIFKWCHQFMLQIEYMSHL